jgi:hypothetical protein
MHQLTTRSRARTAMAAIAAATLLVGGVNIASEAAGSAKPLLLGKSNKAKKTTKLSSKKGVALALKSKKGPALSVNTTDLIANLNADQLDGKTLEQISPTMYTATFYTAGGTIPASSVVVATTAIPGGTYYASVNGLFATGTGDSVLCQLIDYTKFLASGSTDVTSILLTGRASEAKADADDFRVITIVAGHQMVMGCNGTAGVDVAQPGVITLQAVDAARIQPIPGQGPFTPKPGTMKGMAGLR